MAHSAIVAEEPWYLIFLTLCIDYWGELAVIRSTFSLRKEVILNLFKIVKNPFGDHFESNSHALPGSVNPTRPLRMRSAIELLKS
jgi:hypothetical protein